MGADHIIRRISKWLKIQLATSFNWQEFSQVSETGPAHDKTFTCECRFQGYKCQATAKDKKEAKNLAAKEVIAVLDDILLPHEPTYQSKMEAKMEKKAVMEETKKEIRNSRLYNEIKGGVG